MKKEEVLFDLIKALTKSEKRFIKIYASHYTLRGKINYVKLFDAIDKLKEYSKIKLKKKIKNNFFAGISGSTKNYLFLFILDCLDVYHRNSSIGRKTNKYINIAEILSEKRLDQQSNKIIKKTKRLAQESNRFENTITLSSLQKNTEFKRGALSNDKIQSYYKEIFSAIEKMKIKAEYSKIYDELRLKRLQIGNITNPDEIQQLEIFHDSPYFSEPPKNNSFDVNMYYLLSKIEYSKILIDRKNGGIYIRRLLTLFENNINRIADNVSHYLYTLSLFISELVYEKNREEADAALKKIISIPSVIGKKAVSYDIRVQIFQIYYTLLTHIALIFRDYENAIPHIRKLEIERKKIENYLTPSSYIVTQLNIACIYFGAGQYNQALKWCNEAMTHPPNKRDDARYVIRILYLLIHYELGNQIILPSLIQSTHVFLQKMGKSNQFTAIFFKHFRTLIRAESEKEKAFILIQLRKDVLPLLDNKFEKDMFNDINILGWIDRKIKNPSVAI